MKNKVVKIPAKLAVAIAQYYFGRDKQHWQYDGESRSGDSETITLRRSKIPWDKTAALKTIESATPWRFSASGGTFWFNAGKRIIEVHEDIWPLGKTV